MERLTKKGLTLLELLIAITLLTVVLLTASTLLISFKKFYFDFMQRQSEIGEVSLGVLEEIVGRVRIASKIATTLLDEAVGPLFPLPTMSYELYIYVDNTDPASLTDDTIHHYYRSGSAIRYRYKIDGQPWSSRTTIARHIGLLEFTLWQGGGDSNMVKIKIGVIPSGGTQQNFETTVIARARAAEAL